MQTVLLPLLTMHLDDDSILLNFILMKNLFSKNGLSKNGLKESISEQLLGLMREINIEISKKLGREYQIGYSYFMTNNIDV